MTDWIYWAAASGETPEDTLAFATDEGFLVRKARNRAGNFVARVKNVCVGDVVWLAYRKPRLLLGHFEVVEPAEHGSLELLAPGEGMAIAKVVPDSPLEQRLVDSDFDDSFRDPPTGRYTGFAVAPIKADADLATAGAWARGPSGMNALERFPDHRQVAAPSWCSAKGDLTSPAAPRAVVQRPRSTVPTPSAAATPRSYEIGAPLGGPITVVGYDLGYARNRRTTGLCRMTRGADGATSADADHYTADDAMRMLQAWDGMYHPAVIVIDAPLTRDWHDASPYAPRKCRPHERVFMQRPFQVQRLKPGPAFTPRGRALYEPAMRLKDRLIRLGYEYASFGDDLTTLARRVRLGEARAVLEGFPKAWLGLLFAPAHARNHALGRCSHDFDAEMFRALARGPAPAKLGVDGACVQRLEELENGDERTAAACALSGWCVAVGAAGFSAVGCASPQLGGGHFLLPPLSMIDDQQLENLRAAVARVDDAGWLRCS